VIFVKGSWLVSLQQASWLRRVARTGNDLLARFTLFVDYPRTRLLLQPR
jgi:hypothetical protein